MIRALLLLTALNCSAFCGEIEDYFKPISDKSGSHQIRNIDFIYMINLDERPEKLASCLKQLTPYGIDPYRFSAVNGWELSLEAINDVGVKYEPWMSSGQMGTCYLLENNREPQYEMVSTPGRTYFGHFLSPGAIGIVLSHLSILQDAYDSDYETIWVMEDDIEVIQNPHLISDLIEKLDNVVGKDGWDILFTDRDTKNTEGEYVICTSYAWRPNCVPPNPNKFGQRQTVSEDFTKVGARYGAYSMIVRRSGMRKLLRFFKNYHVYLPFDMDYTLPPGIRLYCVNSDLVSTEPRALSDNGVPNYRNRR
ncbi:MAG: glycosyltransferase family 25 protein [Chlamydiales bacterium]|nr:glycosyltransferase family 25 protein [Chlamydiales bacterium]